MKPKIKKVIKATVKTNSNMCAYMVGRPVC